VTTGVRASDITLYRRLAAELRPYWRGIAGILLLSFAATPLSLLTPLPLKIAVDTVIGSQPVPGFLAPLLPDTASKTALLIAAAALLALVTALTYGFALGLSLLQTYTGENLTLGFRAKLFQRAQQLSFDYHDRRGTLDAVYRIQNDATALQGFAISGVVPLGANAVTLFAMIVVTARIDPLLAVVALTICPVLYLLTSISRRRSRARWAELKAAESAALGIVHEVLAALRTVKSFNREEQEGERFVGRAGKLVTGNVRIALIEGGFSLLIGLTIAFGTAAVLVIGVRHVQAGVLSLGSLLLVMGYLAQLYRPLDSISRQVTKLQSYIASAERACALLDSPADVPQRPSARPLRRASGRVAFEHVSFAYGADRVLDDISFDIAAGTAVGIVGRTGAGKTTMMNLLARFYDPTRGHILLDGIDLRDYRVADLRRQFALVLQEPVLFSTTIVENIGYARSDATRDEIVAAAKAANAHDFIARLPEGYDTPVGERGLTLSGGERQRVSLARAFLKDAPILILDEPTSAVDAGTETAIIESLDRLIAGRTSFVIAHRPSTIRHCDLIIHIEGGRLVGIGPAAVAGFPTSGLVAAAGLIAAGKAR
jgi:ATP-binding cassette, subfamily B, bacterial